MNTTKRRNNDNLSPIACILMASGQGRRFGSNKLLAQFQDKPLVSYALKATSKYPFAKRLLVTIHPEVKAISEAFQVPALLHSFPGRGQAIGLGVDTLLREYKLKKTDTMATFSGHSNFSEQTNSSMYTNTSVFTETSHEESESSSDKLSKELLGILFCPCDQPLLQPESIEKLCQCFLKHPEHICRLVGNDKGDEITGAVVIFPKRCFQELLCLPEKAGGSHLIKKDPLPIRTVSVENPLELFDIDTPSDLDYLAGQ